MNNQTRIPDHNLDDVEGEKESLVCDEYDRERDQAVEDASLELKRFGNCDGIDMCDVFQDIRFDKMGHRERSLISYGLHQLYLRLKFSHKTIENSMESLALSEFERQQEQSKCNS